MLEDLFRLPFEFAVPDLLFVRELAGDLGDRLTALGLRVEELSPAELTRATTVRGNALISPRRTRSRLPSRRPANGRF